MTGTEAWAGGKGAFRRLMMLVSASVSDEVFALIEGHSDGDLRELRELASMWGHAARSGEDELAALPEPIQQVLADSRAAQIP